MSAVALQLSEGLLRAAGSILRLFSFGSSGGDPTSGQPDGKPAQEVVREITVKVP